MAYPKPKIKSAFKRNGAMKKGFKYTEDTSGRIPDPAVVPISRKRPNLKPMRSVASGSNAYGAPRKTVKNKARSL